MRDLEELTRALGHGGLEVELLVEGEARELAPGLDLSAYRIVQEGLTNTLKHANAQRATVSVRFGERELELEVADDGDGPVDGKNGGHGLAGLRERAALYGGETQAGPDPCGGFRLLARLPLEGPSG